MGHAMPTGKHKNQQLDSLPSDYLEWVMENWEDENIRQAAEDEYNTRTDESSHWYDD